MPSSAQPSVSSLQASAALRQQQQQQQQQEPQVGLCLQNCCGPFGENSVRSELLMLLILLTTNFVIFFYLSRNVIVSF